MIPIIHEFWQRTNQSCRIFDKFTSRTAKRAKYIQLHFFPQYSINGFSTRYEDLNKCLVLISKYSFSCTRNSLKKFRRFREKNFKKLHRRTRISIITRWSKKFQSKRSTISAADLCSANISLDTSIDSSHDSIASNWNISRSAISSTTVLNSRIIMIRLINCKF